MANLPTGARAIHLNKALLDQPSSLCLASGKGSLPAFTHQCQEQKTATFCCLPQAQSLPGRLCLNRPSRLVWSHGMTDPRCTWSRQAFLGPVLTSSWPARPGILLPGRGWGCSATTHELGNLEVLRAGAPSPSASTMDWMPLNLPYSRSAPPMRNWRMLVVRGRKPGLGRRSR